MDPPLILAPMAGVTDSVYRGIMARHGAGLVTTEMVSVQGIVRGQRSTWELCGLDDLPSVPLAVQLFGYDPDAFAEAARRVEAGGASIVDLNAGCPVKKVVKQGAGARLLTTPEHLLRIVEAVRRAVRIPLTVKLRLGWDASSVNVVELSRRIESAGADAVAIHGRTAAQHYSGRADWSWIGRAKAVLGIPVIGNGDVSSPSLADAMMAETSCDGVMIGRASRGNPWLFSAVADAWDHGGVEHSSAGWTDFHRTVREHAEAFRRVRPDVPGHFRKLLMWYSKECPDGAAFRARLAETDGHDEMLAMFDEWVEAVAAKGCPFLPLKIRGVEGDGGGGEAGPPLPVESPEMEQDESR